MRTLTHTYDQYAHYFGRAKHVYYTLGESGPQHDYETFCGVKLTQEEVTGMNLNADEEHPATCPGCIAAAEQFAATWAENFMKAATTPPPAPAADEKTVATEEAPDTGLIVVELPREEKP